jgi:PAS domain S-box-containing protein
VAVIDRTYRIVTINSAARRLLGIHEAGADQDFLHSVRGLPYEQVRSTIDGVFRERNAVALPELEMEPASGEVRYLTLNVVLMYLVGGARELAVIIVIDVTDQVLTRLRLYSS